MPPFIHLVSAAAVYHMRHPITGDLTVSQWTNKAGWNIISALRLAAAPSRCVFVCVSAPLAAISLQNLILLFLAALALSQSAYSLVGSKEDVQLTSLFTVIPPSCLVHWVICLVHQVSWWSDHKSHKSKLLLPLTLCVISPCTQFWQISERDMHQLGPEPSSDWLPFFPLSNFPPLSQAGTLTSLFIHSLLKHCVTPLSQQDTSFTAYMLHWLAEKECCFCCCLFVWFFLRDKRFSP